jgi:hypothetical protein
MPACAAYCSAGEFAAAAAMREGRRLERDRALVNSRSRQPREPAPITPAAIMLEAAGIDANASGRGNDAFAFSGSIAAANSVWTRASGGKKRVYGNVNGDAVADVAIQLARAKPLGASDFRRKRFSLAMMRGSAPAARASTGTAAHSNVTGIKIEAYLPTSPLSFCRA